MSQPGVGWLIREANTAIRFDGTDRRRKKYDKSIRLRDDGYSGLRELVSSILERRVQKIDIDMNVDSEHTLPTSIA